MTQPPVPRVSPIHGPDQYILPTRAEGAATEAYRQTQFMLGDDLALFAEAMSLQLRLVKESYPSQYRTHSLAAIMGLWSRAYVYLSDTLLLVTRGSYPSTLPLFRAACETIAAEEGLRAAEMQEHAHWLDATLVPNETFKAFEFHLGRYFAGGVIAHDEVLGPIYRPSSDLGRPAFGATLLQVAPESNNNRIAIDFAGASFHLGWAELALGWLLALSGRQLRVIVDASASSAGPAATMTPAIFAVSGESRAACEDIQRRIDAALARPDRCRLDEVDDHGNRRYLVVNFRRNNGAVPKKVLL